MRQEGTNLVFFFFFNNSTFEVWSKLYKENAANEKFFRTTAQSRHGFFCPMLLFYRGYGVCGVIYNKCLLLFSIFILHILGIKYLSYLNVWGFYGIVLIVSMKTMKWMNRSQRNHSWVIWGQWHVCATLVFELLLFTHIIAHEDWNNMNVPVFPKSVTSKLFSTAYCISTYFFRIVPTGKECV